MKCPYCQSSYTEVKHTYEDLDVVKTEYYCTACAKRFTKEIKKSAAEGELVMEVADRGSYSGEHDHIVKFYLTSEGMLTIKQKSSELDSHLNVTGFKFRELTYIPKFKLSKST
jgi:transposase-like protein